MAFPRVEGYVVTEKLGSGSYSTVYKAHTKVGARTVVAIKCVDKSRVKHSGTAVDNLVTEIRLLKTLSHPHIVQMKEFTWDEKNIYIIMEYCSGGDLSRYITKYGRVPEKQVLYFLQQLASALKFLKEKGIVHMDLKPHNLLLHKGSDGKYILKVGDFGFAQYLSSSCSMSVRGSPLYMAPEMFHPNNNHSKADLWSVGIIMYECLFSRAPYASNNFHELMIKVRKQIPIELPPNSSLSEDCEDLLMRLLQHSIDKRITYEEFFEHPYLDLEHMPNKQNYDKAVELVKKAIELDMSGQLEPALEAYCGALRRLVPAAAIEPDPDRKQALTAKLTRYMERAEEIKQYLKTGELPTQAAAQTQRPCEETAAVDKTPVVECSGIGTEKPQVILNVPNNIVPEKEIEDETLPIEEKRIENEATPSSIVKSETKDKIKEKSSRFALKRFFGRQTSIPLLNNNDSTISNTIDKNEKEQNENSTKNSENTNDTCRIT